jgi:LPS sulfotransferase NodH
VQESTYRIGFAVQRTGATSLGYLASICKYAHYKMVSLLKHVLSLVKRHLLTSLYPPFGLFDSSRYRDGNTLSGFFYRFPFLHFLLLSNSQQRRIGYVLFDSDFVEQQLQARGMGRPRDAFRAYLKNRNLWSVKPHPLFDPEYYQGQLNSPLKRAPLLDYYFRGNNAPDPHPMFSQQWYLGRNEHIRDALGFAGATALTHFLVGGYKEGELPNPYFHTIWYANSYLDGDRISYNPLLHYMKEGYSSGHDPSPLFDAGAYTARHPTDDKMNPLEHYLKGSPLVFPAERNRLTDMFWPAIGKATPGPEAGHLSPPDKELLILFTPRSGSTWLAGLMRKTCLLGHPAEWFNFRLVNNHCIAMQSYPENTSDYVDKIRAFRKGENGLFSAELAADHLQDLGEATSIGSHFGQAKYVLLYREDILRQSVSLFLATQSGFFNSSQVGNRKHLPDYDGRAIHLWFTRLLEQERQLLQYCEDRNIRPLQISYEQLRENAQAVVKNMGRYCGVEVPAAILSDIESGQRSKISSSINGDYIQRFNREYGRSIKRLLKKRVFSVQVFGESTSLT